ncbi:uncharacterized protein LOC128547709 [Mercenaria mercenaria]|uniref:uncharacterized protein LOC128547709 n=1 Tax=Mercenaria mercenaria TaxID=6596 RepID=UPI00234E80D8|nr:uncharacterized protein LOC128547709 [Mercenaria mercenaria]
MVGAFLKCMFIYLTSQQLTVEGTDIVWQMCLGRCVHLGLTNASFADQSHYCKSINAKQVHFGHNEEQALATKLLACRLQKLDGESYWIRRHNIQNHNKPICHTMTFSGNTVHFSQNTPCSSLSHPFCETDKSSCQISRSIKGTVASYGE